MGVSSTSRNKTIIPLVLHILCLVLHILCLVLLHVLCQVLHVLYPPLFFIPTYFNGKTTLLTTNFAEKDSSVISKKKMSLMSSKSHFWPPKVTSVHQFLLATTSSLSKGVKRQFCLLKRQFCPVMILTSKLANSVKKLHLSVKTLHILGWNKTYAS